jgi:hypothetical protein
MIFQMPVGAIVDRWPRRRVMISADLARAAIIAALVALIAAGAVTIALLLGAVAAVTVLSCAADPASQAVIPEIIGQDKQVLDSWNGKYWVAFSSGQDLAGPTLGSVAFAASRVLPFAADAASFAASAALTRLLPAGPAQAAPQTRLQVTAGLRHIVATPELRAMTAGIAGYNFAAGCLSGVFVLYSRLVLHVPAAGYGLLVAAMAPPGIVLGLRPRLLTGRLSGRQVIIICCLAQATGWAILAGTGTVWAAVLGMAIFGAANMPPTVAVSTAYQRLTPAGLHGSAWSAYLTIIVGVAGLGALAGGLTARLAGLNAAIILAAVMSAITAIALLPARQETRAAEPMT